VFILASMDAEEKDFVNTYQNLMAELMSEHSAIEKEVYDKLIRLRYTLKSHDRGVLFGLLLSICPVFPVPIFGFIISIVNYNLCKSGKLNFSNGRLIKLAVIFSFVNTIISVTMVFFFIKYFMYDVNLEYLHMSIISFITDLKNKIPFHSFFNNSPKGVYV
jgi:hypothetical protein